MGAEIDVLEQLGDELALQAWLAGAEIRHPSLRPGAVRDDVDALAALRDELRLQLHLGELGAADEFARIEERWRALKGLASVAAGDADPVHALLDEIREGYRRLVTPGARRAR